MTHSFERFTAQGNTFVVLNTWEDPLSLSREAMKTLVRKACDRREGIGSDGLILINQSGLGSPGVDNKGAEFRMDFYNPDGSTGMLCGNGSRCAVEAAREYGFVTTNRTRFEVLGAINRAEILESGSIRVYFQDPTVIRLNFSLEIDAKTITASYIDLGSQHVVVFAGELQKLGAGEIESFDIARYGALLRGHEAFTPRGANSNFIEVREDGDEKYLRIRTFERGVEGETLACGTGCMSSAIAARLTGKISNTPIRLLTQSGEFVTVDFELTGEIISNLSMEGSVVRGEAGTITFDEQDGQFEVLND